MCARLTCLLALRESRRDVNKRHKIYCFRRSVTSLSLLIFPRQRKEGKDVWVINVVVEDAILRSVVFNIQVRIEYTV